MQKSRTSRGSVAARSFALAVCFGISPLGASYALAAAAPVPSPLVFTGSRVSHAKASLSPVLYVHYTNKGSVTADEVRFTADLGPGNTPQTFVAKGAFAPGVSIAHTYPLAAHAHQGTPAVPKVSVQFVHFADGTTWQAAGK